MDSIIIAAIITGSSTIVSAIIGCVTATAIYKNKIKQNVKGNGNQTNATINLKKG